MSGKSDISKAKFFEAPENESCRGLEIFCKRTKCIFRNVTDFNDNLIKKNTECYECSVDECDLKVETEHHKLIKILDLPQTSSSLNERCLKFSRKLKYGVRSGFLHMNLQKFSPLTRGLQGPAIAVAALATSNLTKPHCWSHLTVDQIVDDGDTYYKDSCKHIQIEDRRTLKIFELKKNFTIQKNYEVTIKIDEPIFAGTFRAISVEEPHISEALELFFKKHKACILISTILNIAIWNDEECFFIFDGQARLENCNVTDTNHEKGSAKLIASSDLAGVIFIILEKSNVKNESFTIHETSVINIEKITKNLEFFDNKVPEIKFCSENYKVQEIFQAVFRGSCHLYHHSLPSELRGQSHLIIAVAMIVYCKILSTNKWTKVIIDLLFNQANTYFINLLHLLGKTSDSELVFSIDELPSDIVFGVYKAKIHVENNVIPGNASKEKLSLSAGLRNFFQLKTCGLIEVRKCFYAIWKEKNLYFLFDPFPCDNSGNRVSENDTDEDAAACVIMNSSIEKLEEVLLKNTNSKEKDFFIIHNLEVLHIMAGKNFDCSRDKIIYRTKRVNCKAESFVGEIAKTNDCSSIDNLDSDGNRLLSSYKDKIFQFPEMMKNINISSEAYDDGEFFMKNNAFGREEDSIISSNIIENSHRIVVRGNFNIHSNTYKISYNDSQGLIVAIGALGFRIRSKPESWNSYDIDKIIRESHITYVRLIEWIKTQSSTSQSILQHIENRPQMSLSSSDSFKKRNMDPYEKKSINYLELSMLPRKISIGDLDYNVVSKLNTIEGDANPLANLKEALEQYFKENDQMIFENERCMYPIWKHWNNFYMLNSYGADKEGYMNLKCTAALFIVDNIDELLILMYNVFEINGYHFIIHKIIIRLESVDSDFESVEETTVLPLYNNHSIKFLPITDEYIGKIENGEKPSFLPSNKKNSIRKISEHQKSPTSTLLFEEFQRSLNVEEKRKNEPLVNEREENIYETPPALNLAIVTGLVRFNVFRCQDGNDLSSNSSVENIKIAPFVNQNIQSFQILSSKHASKSVCSLVSRFSMRSNLPAEKYTVKEDVEKILAVSSKNRVQKVPLPIEKCIVSKNFSNKIILLRAINNKFIKKLEADVGEIEKKGNTSNRLKLLSKKVFPKIISFGHCIKCPKTKKTTSTLKVKEKVECQVGQTDPDNYALRRLITSTENILLQFFLPNFKKNDVFKIQSSGNYESMKKQENSQYLVKAECCGFLETDDSTIGIIQSQKSLENRFSTAKDYFKPCFYAAILCVLVKIISNVNKICPTVIDDIIEATKKISKETENLKYTMFQKFQNINILKVKYSIIIKQIRYADPKGYQLDNLKKNFEAFFKSYCSGILVFENVSYAFWKTDDFYYLFDPYKCDENGCATEVNGNACLMKIRKFLVFIARIVNNTNEKVNEPYRLYCIEISRMKNRYRRKKKIFKKSWNKNVEENTHDDQLTSECPCLTTFQPSLIELADWTQDGVTTDCFEPLSQAYVAMKKFKASLIEVEIFENDINRVYFPLTTSNEDSIKNPRDGKYCGNSIVDEPLDLCLMAWAKIYEPTTWSTKTIKGIVQECKEYIFDCGLVAEDTSTNKCSDFMINEFTIANYIFQVTHSAEHNVKLYSKITSNLAQSLEKIFGSPKNTGAIVMCAGVFIGTMKIQTKMYAWWLLKKTKKLRIIVSENMEDYLKLIIKDLDQPEEIDVAIRAVTISCAELIGPNCRDVEGLHDSVLASSKITEIRSTNTFGYDVKSVFRSTRKCQSPVFVQGNTVFRHRWEVVEPKMKKCYFTALFAVVLKKDITQNPSPSIIDKVLHLGDKVYGQFEKPVFHTEHILKDVSFLERTLNFRDHAIKAQCLENFERKKRHTFYFTILKQLKLFFKRYSSGIIQFPNCCYGFWYSDATDCYYYLDPYQCDDAGKKIESGGYSCLCIFPSLSSMVNQMTLNKIKNTTGFILHCLHVDLTNNSRFNRFQEDSIWLYLDYDWSYVHNVEQKKHKARERIHKRKHSKYFKRKNWKNYFIEVPDRIYSMWGTIGSFDSKFSSHPGENQVAVAVAFAAIRDLWHPAEWTPAILDFAVISGDHYFQKNSKYFNNNSNSELFSQSIEILSYRWKILFQNRLGGFLFSTCNADQSSFITNINSAFNTAFNIIVQCEKKTITVLKTSDAFYAIDSSWVGPPLFLRNHGSAYVIRCKNINVLLYVLVRMINTNQKVQYVINPLTTIFDQRSCKFVNGIFNTKVKADFNKTVYYAPGKVLDNNRSLVPGNQTEIDESNFYC